MIYYLYANRNKYYSGKEDSYINLTSKLSINPKKISSNSNKELLCLFIISPSENESKKIAEDFNFEEKYILNFKNESRSVRYSFNPLVFCMTDYIRENENKIHITRLLMIIKENILCIISSERSNYFEELFSRVIERAKKRKIKSETYILYEFLHQDTKENYEVIERLDDKLEDLQRKVIFSNEDEKRILQEIMSHKKYLIKMSKRLWSSSKIIFTIKKELTTLKLTKEEQSLLDDIYDTLVHQIDLIETQKETVTDILEIYTTTLNNKLAVISNNLNVVMKKMAALTLIIMVPTLIASTYGMNFKNMPELEWYYGYPFAIGLMIITAYLTYKMFHKKGWI
ncbi:MAG: magnesium and cobalt transport protein CorA [Candidatus Woesearchaeota archaeon]|nr:MAG: magnesium and cobalt transport protein CorA [Candidatus Woesearchaeota archaeon]